MATRQWCSEGEKKRKKARGQVESSLEGNRGWINRWKEKAKKTAVNLVELEQSQGCVWAEVHG